MKVTEYTLFTLRNNLNYDNNIIYNMMLRGGFIRKLCNGVFILLPNGLRVINNIINVIKIEMNKINSIEIELPVINPSYLWNDSGRINTYGKELFKVYDRTNRLFILSPTNEELITNFFFKNRNNINNLPKIFYQIKTKFRDEIRSRAGIIRCKEFLMKEAYSFHKSKSCLEKTYINILDTYNTIFNKLNLDILYKEADCGNIGGTLSHEFHYISKYGEDDLLINKNIIFKIFPKFNNNNLIYKIKRIKFLIYKNFNKYYFLKKHNLDFIKTYLIKIYFKIKKIFLIVLIPYYKKIDLYKIKNLYPLSYKIVIYSKKKIKLKFNIKRFFLCPFYFNYRIIADISISNIKNFIIGANVNNGIFINVNWFKNINVSGFYYICKNINFLLKNKFYNENICSFKSVEIAHVFNLLDSYINNYLTLNNKIFMGCYGIGVYRILTSLIEHYTINNSIVLPISISNFKIGIIPINFHKNKCIYNISLKIYDFLIKNGIEVLLDDRNIHIGIIFKDLELIGIPNFLIISNKLLSIGLLEFKDRLNNFVQFISIKNIFDFLLFKYK